MIARWTRSITTLRSDPRLRLVALTGYYLAILAAVIAVASFGAFDTPAFVYQGF
jgi:hypothetical protein